VTHGITNSIYLLDPDGNKIEIYAEVFPTAQEGIDYMRAQEGYGVTAPITL
jgi:catechol-2,3-dioxygenase